MRRTALIVFALIALSRPGLAQDETGASERFEDSHAAREFADGFLDLVMEEKIQAAFDSARHYWPAGSPAQIDALVLQTIRQREAALPTYGAKVGIEFVREDRMGGSFLRLVYLEKRQLHALVWVFLFYSADGNTWQLNSLLWNDKAMEAF